MASSPFHPSFTCVCARDLHAQPHNLILCPIPPHILSPERAHLLVEMGPQDGAPALHPVAQLREVELLVAALAAAQVGLEVVETRVDGGVLLDHGAGAGVELGHAGGEAGEEVRLLDGVVGGEVGGEGEAGVEELVGVDGC